MRSTINQNIPNTLFSKVLVLLVALSSQLGMAKDIDSLFMDANKLYQQESYSQALTKYHQIEAENEVSAALYFNMGNCYYKTNQIAPSIYYFEKALVLSPNNEDVLHNLAFANRMVLDNIEPLPKNLGEKFMDAIVLKMTYESWAKISVGLAFVFALLFLLYHFSYSTARKRFFFVSSGIVVILVTTCLFMAFRNHRYVSMNQEAIIFSEEVEVKSAPTNSSEVYFELHEGTKVKILEQLDNWRKIKIVDGKIGWIDANSIKEI